MFKELLQHAIDMKRYGTVARAVPVKATPSPSPVLAWMDYMVFYASDSLASLVDHELRTQDQDARYALISMLRGRLPAELQSAQDDFVARWEAQGLQPEFWRRDTVHLLQGALADARNVLARIKEPPYGEVDIGMVYLVVLEFTARAHDDPDVRTRMGLRGEFPRKPRKGQTLPKGIHLATRR